MSIPATKALFVRKNAAVTYCAKLFFLLKANLTLVVDYGVMALKDGALSELVMLFLFGIISLLSYVAFKVYEKTLVEHLTQKPPTP